MARILIIDDETTIVRVLSRLCTRIGHEVIECQDVEHAIQVMRSNEQFDLIITDIIMPGQSGLEFISWLQKSGYDKRIVVMTAYPNHEFLDYARDHGALDVLTKPFSDLQTIDKKIKGWLSMEPGRRYRGSVSPS